MLRRRRRFIREKAEALLREASILSPEVDPLKIAHRYDISVRVQAIDGDIFGLLLRQPGKAGAIIGISANQPPNRRRFTLAHELGHFFLHSDQGSKEVHVDSKSRFLVKLRDSVSSKGTDEEEMEANLFAAELLMPARFLEVDVLRMGGFDLSEDDDAIARLATRYGVSTQAMSYRLAYLRWNNVEDSAKAGRAANLY